MRELLDTNAAEIAAEFVAARTRAGSPAMGMVLTLVIVVPESESAEAFAAARQAAREHPARIVGIILGSGRGAGRLNAQVGIGDGWSGETALIRLYGEVVKHAESVVRPLLLPDSPVAVWWPTDPPEDPARDPIGALADRRITDASAVTRRHATALLTQCGSYAPGNTDLAWPRITRWRALLAAALDQHPGRVSAASVTSERVSPSGDLLHAWLSDRLGVPVARHQSAGPGITEAVLVTGDGEIRIHRTDGAVATFSSPGRPDRMVTLPRRQVHDLLAEELRHLDDDDIYRATVQHLIALTEASPPTPTAQKK